MFGRVNVCRVYASVPMLLTHMCTHSNVPIRRGEGITGSSGLPPPLVLSLGVVTISLPGLDGHIVGHIVAAILDHMRQILVLGHEGQFAY